MTRQTIEDLLAEARSELKRVDAEEAHAAVAAGATLIDIRTEAQITQAGTAEGALLIARNVLEWRLDPTSGHRHPRAPDPDDQVIVMCQQGYASSLAAATLQQLGFARATDLDGGFDAWLAAGLPVRPVAR